MQYQTKKIAINTIFLYIRSFITILIGIYTSRVLLSILGVEDYGIYNLVGGVVIVFASLKNMFASSLQRFLNIEKGFGTLENVNVVFNLGLLVNICFAIFFIFIVEPSGLWLISTKLNIPEESLSDAYFVFHFSIISAVVSMLVSTFDAIIIANEKIRVFAWISMINSILKLFIVYSLPYFSYSHLKCYAALMLIVTLLDALINILFCRNFPECKISFVWDKKKFFKIVSFSGWNFLGNTAFSVVNEGINMILNVFGGVAYNASRAIAYQLKSAMSILCSNIIVASTPYIIQQAAKNDLNLTFIRICTLSRFTFLIMGITIFPFITYTNEVLTVWLVSPPVMSEIFVKIILLHLLLRTFHSSIDILFKAFGDIKYYQIFDSLILFLSLPFSYLSLRLGFPIYNVFIIMLIVEIINLFSLILLVKYQLNLSILFYFKEVILYSLKIVFVFSIISFFSNILYTPTNILELLIIISVFVIIELLFSYIIILSPKEKKIIRLIFTKKIKK